MTNRTSIYGKAEHLLQVITGDATIPEVSNTLGMNRHKLQKSFDAAYGGIKTIYEAKVAENFGLQAQVCRLEEELSNRQGNTLGGLLGDDFLVECQKAVIDVEKIPLLAESREISVTRLQGFLNQHYLTVYQELEAQKGLVATYKQQVKDCEKTINSEMARLNNTVVSMDKLKTKIQELNGGAHHEV